MTNDQLIQKIYDAIDLEEKKSESLERTVALFDAKKILIDIAIDENLSLKVGK